MENAKLLELMEADREMILAAVNRDRSPAAAQAALEKAMDRVMLRHAEQCRDPKAREAGQLIMASLKSALPLMDSVGEVRRWQRTAGAADTRRPGALTWAALAVGVLLVLATLMGMAFTGGGGLMGAVKGLLPMALGLAGVFWAGMRFAKPSGKAAPESPADVRDEFLVDAERLWHHLRGMLLTADAALADASARAAAEAGRERQAANVEADTDQVELFAGLLEGLYAQDTPDAREMAESIRFYLHGAKLEVTDFEKGREAWFEFLPAQRPGTIRPALVRDGRLVKKGLAAL